MAGFEDATVYKLGFICLASPFQKSARRDKEAAQSQWLRRLQALQPRRSSIFLQEELVVAFLTPPRAPFAAQIPFPRPTERLKLGVVDDEPRILVSVCRKPWHTRQWNKIASVLHILPLALALDEER